MTTDNFCFYLQNRLIQTDQTGGQLYSDTSPFSVPWLSPVSVKTLLHKKYNYYYLSKLHLNIDRNNNNNYVKGF